VKVVILAGGVGTRLSEETDIRPKPMVDVGGQPLIWHIMKQYEAYGFFDFVVALGYKGEFVKRYFLDYNVLSGSISVSLSDGKLTPIDGVHERWNVRLIDSGHETNTGGRLKRLSPWLRDETFMLTYGDGVSDVDFDKLVAFHQDRGKLATITAVHPPSRFGEMVFDEAADTVRFTEKPQMGEGWINGGFMVFEPEVLDMIEDDAVSLEADVLEQLSRDGQLVAFRHDSFWQCMDTLRDVRFLRSLWDSGKPPWVTWA
jgi:glucose-1-phosphate cytidylyltransferase